MIPHYTHLIIDEDGTVTGTSNQACADAFKTADTFTVINLATLGIEFMDTTESIKEQQYNPADWE